MISEPNFVLGIKQTSLASKEEYHVHTIIRSYTCFSARSWLHGILQPPWLYAVSKSNKLKQSRDLILQICANPCFAWWYQHHRRAPRPPARKTQKFGQPKANHAPPCAAVSSGKSTTHRLRFLTSRSSSWSTRHPDGLVVHRPTWPENLVVIRRRTRHLGFWHLLHAPVDLACTFHAPKHCCWRHHSMSAATQARPRQQEPRQP